MKLKEIKRLSEEINMVESWLEDFEIMKFTILPSGIVDVHQDVI